MALKIKASLTKIFVATVITIVSISLTAVKAEEWQLVWQEDFDGANVSESTWNYETGCDGFGNNELQCYVQGREENARITDGKLVIQARKEWWGDGISPDKQFTSAKLTSKESWTYGKFEIRARLPKGKHLWPAFWMMPSSSVYGGWPASGEIDIMEYRGQRTYQTSGTAHFGPSWNNKGAVGTGERDFPIDFSQDFHTFGFHWDEYAVRWIIDGNQFHSEGTTKNFWPGFYTKDGQPFDQPFYLILNLAVGGTFFPSSIYGDFHPDEADSWERPYLEIDWIKVWQWK